MKIYAIYEIVDYESPLLVAAYKSKESSEKALKTCLEMYGTEEDYFIKKN